MANLVSTVLEINGQKFSSSGSQGIYFVSSNDNKNKQELYVGQDGAYSYVLRQDYGRGTATLKAQSNTVGSRALNTLQETNAITTMLATFTYSDGNVVTVSFQGVAIQNTTNPAQIGTQGEVENIEVEYNITYANHQRIE